jgi:hypothetical protein
MPIIWPGIIVLDRTDRRTDNLCMVECINPEPRCDTDLHNVGSVGTTLLDAIYNLRSFVEYYHSYDHCAGEGPV